MALWGLTTFFNPADYRSRLANYRVFRRDTREQGLALLTVELAFGEAPFVLERQDAEILVQLRTGAENVMWHKEALLNAGLARLPGECDLVGWLDADVLFTNPGWVTDAQRALQEHPVVQLFEFVRQPAAGETVVVPCTLDAPGCFPGFGLGRRRLGAGWTRPFGHSGLAWAARRRLLERHRFFDRGVLGDGDGLMAYALTGHEAYLDRVEEEFPPAMIADYRCWAVPVFEDVQSEVGCLPGTILSLWHGEIVNRNYGLRRAILKRHDFDPRADLVRDENGIFCWNTDKVELRADAREYFFSRREDD